MSSPQSDADAATDSVDLDGLASDVPHSPPAIYREQTIEEKWASQGFSVGGPAHAASPSASPGPDDDFVLVDTFFVQEVADGTMGNNGEVLKLPLPASYASIHAKHTRSTPQRERESHKPQSKPKVRKVVERVNTKPRVQRG